MRSRADRSVTSFTRLALVFVLISLVLLAACGKEKTPTNTPPAQVVIGVAPFTVTLARGTTQTFTATVTNTSNTAVNWSVDEGAAGGSITSAGVYTPPTTVGTYHVTATSQADTSKKATATVTVTDAAVVAVTPATAELAINATQTFTATVTDVIDVNQAVTWSVQETTGGEIDAETGVYTAPNKAGTYHIVATSVAFPAKKATAAVKVTAPAPTFASTAPIDAAEAEVYTYTPAATDPAGGTIELALISGPQGATFEEGVLTWTPTKEQSRVENTFTVSALSSEGGTAVQEWTVTPTGIIRGKMMAKHVHEAGVTDVPVDLSSYYIYAYVPAEDGTLTEYEGQGTPEGTFEIPGVAAGKYWLSLDHGVLMAEVGPEQMGCDERPSLGWEVPYHQILTDRSDIDLSCYVQGRPDVTLAQDGTMRHFQIQGLNPWNDANDEIDLAIPNAGEWDYWWGLDPDAVSYDGVRSAYNLATGDTGFLGQWTSATSTGGRPYGILTKVLTLPKVTDVDGETSTITGTMQDVAGTHAFDASIAGTEFKKLNALINPNATTYGSELYIETHPFGLSHGFVDYGPGMFGFVGGLWADEDGTNPPVETDVYLGQFTYGNPFPTTWPLFAEYWHDTGVQYNTPAGTTLLNAEYYQLTDALPTLAHPVKPILGPVTNAAIGEGDFFADQEILATPTVSWEEPETGSAQGYVIRVLSVVDGAMYTENVFLTTDTSVTVPAGVLQPGTTYIFAIEALNETGKDLASTPYMKGFPRAGAWTTSGLLTVTAPTAPAFAANAVSSKKLSGFKPMHKLTKSLGGSRHQFKHATSHK